MFVFRSNEEKTLEFSLSLENVEKDELSGFLRIIVDDIEYSFKGSFNENNKFVVIIPPLDTIIKSDVQNGEYPVRLEMNTPDDTTYRIWEDNILLRTKRFVTVENVAESVNSSPSIKGIESPARTKQTPFDKKSQHQDISDMKRVGSLGSGAQVRAEKDLQRAVNDKIREDEEIKLPSWFK